MQCGGVIARITCAAFAVFLVGCGGSGYQADARVLGLVSRAEFGRARGVLATQAEPNNTRTDLLNATKRGMMALADGLPDAADRDFAFVFETLRTQGLNDDRTTESIFVNEEGVRIWKGEPFEQAMAYTAIALADGSRGDWGNVRASAENALFHLRDYTETDSENTDEIEYESIASDFALGYLLKGIAALEMSRREEAEEALAGAVKADATLASVRDVLLGGRYDTILVVDYGLGPRREAVGSGGVAVRYSPRTRSDNAMVSVTVASSTERFPQVCDVNAMSRDARWQSRESIRRFKQGFGDVMLAGGLVLASTGGTGGDDDIARLAAGAGMMLLGAIAQSNSRADTRHNELLPQRVYVVPFTLGGYEGPVRVQVDNHPGSLMTLHGLHIREPGETVLRYVRLPIDRVDWATADTILYANDATGKLDQPTLPWIMGGRDARFPTQDVARDAEAAGLQTASATDPIIDTLGEIRELYRAEGITLFAPDDTRLVTGHMFEGGHSLYTPLPGTTGFTRLFARVQSPYRPETDQLREFLAEHVPNPAAADTLPKEETP